MPRLKLEIDVAITRLDSGLYLGEGLLFPEVSRLGDSARVVASAVAQSARCLIAELPAQEISRRQSPSKPRALEVELAIEPPSDSLCIDSPVNLRFDTLRWLHGDEMALAFVPALGLVVHGRDLGDLEARLSREIRAALFRKDALTSLRALSQLQRGRRLLLRREQLSLTLPTPTQREKTEQRPLETKSTLREVARKLTSFSVDQAFEIDEEVAALAEALTAGRTGRSVLLVGPSGVGKTALVLELVRRRKALLDPTGRRGLWQSSGSRLVAGMSGFGMWQERCQALCREAAKKGAILHLGNLHELAQVGRSEHNSQGIASFLRPFIERGELQVIVECTAEQRELIEREEGHLLDVFHQLEVTPPSREQLRGILGRRAVAWSTPDQRAGDGWSEALDLVVRLHERFAAYSARPGRPLRFLEGLLRSPSMRKASRVTNREVTRAFSRETGMPELMIDDAQPLVRDEALAFFNERVMGQPRAVELAVDVLGATKAAMSRPGQPLASLMFIGPTGVGKTELAKVLAEYLFGSPDRLTRFDMSEYGSPAAVARLTGGARGGEGRLTAAIREQPFSVVLLDEVEKAHPLLFDLLLQVLGEARLTDAGGRTADFSSALVIMTSNLGAEAYTSHPLGFQEGDRGRAAEEQVLRAVRDFYRPELLNRIDRVVPFSTLSRETIEQVARRMLSAIRGREGVAYRGVELTFDEGLAQRLAEVGYDRRYGARPLRRAIEREVLAPLSAGLNRSPSRAKLTARISVAEEGRIAPEIDVDGQRGVSEKASELSTSKGLLELAARATEARRSVQLIERSPAVLELRNELFRLRRDLSRLERRQSRRRGGAGKPPSHDHLLHQRLSSRAAVDEALQATWDRVCDLEEEALLTLYRDPGAAPDPEMSTRLRALEGARTAGLLSLYSLRFDAANRATLGVYSQNNLLVTGLAAAYGQLLGARGLDVRYAAVAMVKDDATGAAEPGPVAPWRRRMPELDSLGAFGVALQVVGEGALPRILGEAGLHKFKIQDELNTSCLVHCSEATLDQYRPPAGIERVRALRGHQIRRLYHPGEGWIDDKRLGRKTQADFWTGLGESLGAALDEALRVMLEEALLR